MDKDLWAERMSLFLKAYKASPRIYGIVSRFAYALGDKDKSYAYRILTKMRMYGFVTRYSFANWHPTIKGVALAKKFDESVDNKKTAE